MGMRKGNIVIRLFRLLPLLRMADRMSMEAYIQ